METTRITVYDYQGARFNAAPNMIHEYMRHEPVEMEVDAYLVGDIRAHWIASDVLYTAHGVDSHWWLTSKIPMHHFPSISRVMEALMEEYKDVRHIK